MDNWVEIAIISVLVIVVILVFGLLIDTFTMHDIGTLTGKIVDMQYSPSKSSVGVGPAVGVDSQGNAVTGVVVVSNSENEKWTIIVQYEKGVQSIEVSPEIYYRHEIGDIVKFQEQKGILGLIKDYAMNK